MSQLLCDNLQGPWFSADAPDALQRFWAEVPKDHVLHKHVDFINGIVSASPYLRGLLLADLGFAALALNSDPQHLADSLRDQVVASAFCNNIDETGKHLRLLKSKMALLCALADIGRAWPVMEVTRQLTLFADCAVAAAVNALLRQAVEQEKLTRLDPLKPAQGCSYVVLAMGKHGAFELNYSSDIDLIVLFDPETAPMFGDHNAAAVFIRMTKNLVALLQDITIDGYVFRTDLRLRPDPRATQVAIPIEAAAHYYENLGQNWERAAFIKARAVAGDVALGEEFLNRLKPYIWRKYLDFAAIADVQSLIRQIHAVKGHGEIAVAGHNLKLGRGGIREIEFFVQTQQLIAGGRNLNLRGRATLDMLDALMTANWISPEVAEDLRHCYRALRCFEHRSQMIDDQQTHLVPHKPEAIAAFARFSGFATLQEFSVALRRILETVQRHSTKLFEASNDLGGEAGSLVFTGGEDDPNTIETLQRLGFSSASEVSATIRGWHFGRYAATRTRRAREDLTQLMPALLNALSRDGDADRSFLDFDRFLEKLPSGVQLFAMLKANPDLLDLIARILSTAPRLSAELSRRPRVLEAVLEPGFFGPFPTFENLASIAATLISDDLTLEDAMDRARVFGREQQFRVGVRVLSETVSAEAAGVAYANIADVILARLLVSTQREMQQKHGAIANGRVAVVALGKLGGQEMTASSDLDLILVYDHAVDAPMSDGPRPLSAGQYFTKLAQRFISALNVATSEGELFEVDMRLRPSGSKGPVATSFNSFKTYHAESAWTWERLALTRARVVAGDASFQAELAHEILSALVMPRDAQAIQKDVRDMRHLMLREHHPSTVWDIKRMRGGLVEIEFIAQFLQLVHGPKAPDILHQNTLSAIAAVLEHNILSKQDAEHLMAASAVYHRLTQILRLCLDGPFHPDQALLGLNRAIARAAEMPNVAAVELVLADHAKAVSGLFDRLIGSPTK